MIKNKLDFKLINVALIAIICFFIYQLNALWLGIFGKVLKIILPLFTGFVIAYALHPILQFLTKYKIPKGLGIALIMIIIVSIVIMIAILLIPLLSNQILSLIDLLIVFIKDLSINLNIDFGSFGDTIMNTFNQIITNVGRYVSSGAVKTINASISVITNTLIALASSVYMLLDMDRIKEAVKKCLINKSKKIYNYVKTLDCELKSYIRGFLILIYISFFEYTILYYIIGHPNALLLGFLSGLSNFIPYFGGILVQIIGIITGFTISPRLGLTILIATLIGSFIDSYFINPLVYGKSNQIHPLIAMTAAFSGGILFGFIGIVVAVPLSIVLVTTYKFFIKNKKGECNK